jgi:hypothetical protein
MKIAFFEVKDEEREFFRSKLKEHELLSEGRYRKGYRYLTRPVLFVPFG